MNPDVLKILRRCKTAIVRLFSCLVYYSGALALLKGFANRFQLNQRTTRRGSAAPILRRRFRNVQILTYHRVNSEGDPFFPGVPTSVFASQMEYLAANCTVLSLEEAISRMTRRDVPGNAIVVTFDDGYRDNYLEAFPILKRLSLPATIFLASGAIGSGKCLWHDRVFSAFRRTTRSKLDAYGGAQLAHPLDDLGTKLSAQARVLSFLRTLTEDDRDRWINELEARLEVPDGREASGLMLSWDEVKIMHRDGITFGSHTATHPVLTTLTIERMRQEIHDSKSIIEARLQAPIYAFAYPNGTRADFNQSAKGLVREAGFKCAVTTIFGTNDQDQDLFELRRGGPWESHLPTFAVKLGWYKFSSAN